MSPCFAASGRYGVWGHERAYLRDAFNQLDAFIVAVSLLTRVGLSFLKPFKVCDLNHL